MKLPVEGLNALQECFEKSLQEFIEETLEESSTEFSDQYLKKSMEYFQWNSERKEDN